MPLSVPVSSRAVKIVKLGAGTYLLISTAIIVFGRNVPAIWQGMFGLLASLEGYYGAESLNTWRVLFYLLCLIACVAVSCTLGVLAVTGSELLVDCGGGSSFQKEEANQNTTRIATSSANFDSCSTSFKLYGFVELLGGAGVGLICLVATAASYKTLAWESEQLDAKKDAMEISSLKGFVNLDKT
jgi:hypothetical protein